MTSPPTIEHRPSPNHGERAPGKPIDMLILHTLTIERMHGYAIVQHIKRLTDETLKVEAGSLYPALERLQKKGWLTSRWEPSPTGRKARYYTITAAGAGSRLPDLRGPGRHAERAARPGRAARRLHIEADGRGPDTDAALDSADGSARQDAG